MNAASILYFSWVDYLIVGLLCVGLWRGRKRGMSEELLDICKWAVIVVAAGLLYEPSGRLLAQATSVFSLFSCYVFAYALIAATTFGLFAVLRNRVGSKIVGSDVFGSGEYYLGMAAGVFRYSCIIVVGMAFLNARHYSQEDLAASTRYQEENFGSHFFMTWPDLQAEVFTRSVAGRMAHYHLQAALIQSTAPGAPGLSNTSNSRRRSINEVLDKAR